MIMVSGSSREGGGREWTFSSVDDIYVYQYQSQF